MKIRRRVRNIKIFFIAGIIAVFFVGAMSYNIYSAKKQNKEYVQEQENLKKKIKEEKQRTKQIKKYDEYTKSNEYIENTAKSKLGLANDNEIIFKEESK
ncbi:FtsB family cell division protein [Lachnobacterium bovis]|uniref:Cell division protein DivIC n=1 Tax=Lachnobacterium bovis TaxID=140626 RepID=A0A1H9SQ15_9FIRM|nr:septum formation initiator family protein [Lachnobacterium bovis]SER86503.1 cell division protein DivIC [Lachnobacterium bovis]